MDSSKMTKYVVLLQAVQALNIHRGVEQSPISAFIADEEARDDLCSLGMADACMSQIAAAARDSYGGQSDSPAVARLEKRGHSFTSEHQGHKRCKAAHRLVFHHVMKSGGVSVRKFLECVCADRHCGILRMDGERGLDRYLDNSCEPAICTSHANAHRWNEEDRCGPKFLAARQFTMLRDPVDRVWSFYNYVREHYKPFQERSLVSILKSLGKEDLNEGLPAGERCTFCGVQLSNAMIKGMFCGLSPQACEDLRSGNATADDKSAALDAAKGTLQNMSAIFLFEDINEFPAAYQRSKLPLHRGVRTKLHCKIGQDNPTRYAEGENLELDDETRLWIERLNSDDIKFFEYARSLPNVVRPQL